MVLEVLQKEIPTCGVGYLILRDCPEDRLGEALGKGMEKLKKAGAETVLATSLPEGEPLRPGPVGVWQLSHAYDMACMECHLSPDRPQPEVQLELRPAKKAQEESAYLELMARACQAAPGAMPRQNFAMRLQNHRYGLAFQGETLVGAYELDLSEKLPVLAALAIEPALWRQGLGRALLRTALAPLSPKLPACRLEVSTANAPALALFSGEGFVATALSSSWFQVI